MDKLTKAIDIVNSVAYNECSIVDLQEALDILKEINNWKSNATLRAEKEFGMLAEDWPKGKCGSVPPR